jgi:type IV pilus secretin PilQ/predicted competence protein
MRGNNVVRLIKLILLMLLFSAPVSLPEELTGTEPGPALIQDFTFKSSPNQTVILIHADRSFNYNSYYPNPRLFILDVPSAQSKLVKNFVDLKTSQVDSATLTQIGEGQKPLVRVEFNLRQSIQSSLQKEGSKLRLTFVTQKPFEPSVAGGVAGKESSAREQLAKPNQVGAPTSINDVTIQEGEDQLQFTLLTTAKPSFKPLELTGPTRLVIDVENSNFKISRHAVKVNSDLVQRIRFGYGESNQGKLVRCVFDLARNAPYEIVATESGLVIRFRKKHGQESWLSTEHGIRAEQANPHGEEKVAEPLQELPSSSPLSLDAKPLVSAIFDEMQRIVMPRPLAAPINFPAIEETVSFPDMTLNNRRPNIGTFGKTLDVAKPLLKEDSEVRPDVQVASKRPDAAGELQGNADLKVLNLPPAAQKPTSTNPRLPQHQASNRTILDEQKKRAALPSPLLDYARTDPPQAGTQSLTRGHQNIVIAQLVPPPPALAAQTVQPKPVSAQQSQPTTGVTPPAPPTPQPLAAQPNPGQVISLVNLNQTPKYSGELISLELKDADIKDFFRLVGEISGLNIVLDPDVKGNLTIFLNDVPWDQALDVVLKNNSLGKQVEGNVLRVASNVTLQAEEEQRKRLADARVLAAELQTETRVLSYAKAVDLSAVLKKILSPRGDIIVDSRTNSMIISEIPGKFPAIDTLIRQLDKKIKQVEIEARVIAATRDFLRDIGVQFGVIVGNNAQNKLAGAVPGNPFTRTPPPSVTIQPGQSGGAPDSLPLNVNLGAKAATSGLSFFGGFTHNVLLDAIITAAEARGNAKLLSKPKIITQDNIEGFVQQGVKIPVQTIVNNTVSVQFFDFALKLKVTPQITDEGTINLNVNVENSSPDFSRQVAGIPTINTQETRTTVLVDNGGTVVIGGVLIDNEQVNIRQVPGVGSIPVIGNLFKNRSVNKQTQELIFFISPKIL